MSYTVFEPSIEWNALYLYSPEFQARALVCLVLSYIYRLVRLVLPLKAVDRIELYVVLRHFLLQSSPLLVEKYEYC